MHPHEMTDPEFLHDLAKRASVCMNDRDRLEEIAKRLEENQFILRWLDGKTEVIVGKGIQDACNRAGIGNGALSALDYWEEVTV
jgi:hypothetical protein